MSSSLKIDGVDKIERLGNNFRFIRLEQALNKAVLEASYIAEGAIKYGITAMKAVDTGFMRASTQVKRFQTGQYPSSIVGPTAYYAIYVHEGTRYVKPRRYIPFGISANIKKFEGALSNLGEDITLRLTIGL